MAKITPAPSGSNLCGVYCTAEAPPPLVGLAFWFRACLAVHWDCRLFFLFTAALVFLRSQRKTASLLYVIEELGTAITHTQGVYESLTKPLSPPGSECVVPLPAYRPQWAVLPQVPPLFIEATCLSDYLSAWKTHAGFPPERRPQLVYWCFCCRATAHVKIKIPC